LLRHRRRNVKSWLLNEWQKLLLSGLVIVGVSWRYFYLIFELWEWKDSCKTPHQPCETEVVKTNRLIRELQH